MVINAARILRVADHALGLEEEPRGSNDGSKLRDYLKHTPFRPGEPWCFYFALAVYIDAFDGPSHIPKYVLHTGSCQAAADYAARTGNLRESSSIGSIFVLANAQGHFHHAGIVASKPTEDHKIRTYEGNTNLNGSREGYGVFTHWRPLRGLKFIAG